jgi:regulator of sigma E protease
LLSIIAVILVISILILSHEFGHFLVAKKMGVKVEIFSIGLGPKLWSMKKGDTEYAISAIPLGGYVKMAGEEPGEKQTGAEWEFYSKPVYKRCNIVIAGSAVNFILGALLFCLVFMSPVWTSAIGEVREGSPAQEIGLKTNDRIIKINWWGIRHWRDVLKVLAISDDKVNIIVERNGKIFEFDVQKREEEIELTPGGKPIKKKIIGISPMGETIKYNIFGAIAMGIREALSITGVTIISIWKLLTGSLPIKMMSGPVAIFAFTGQAARVGLIPLLDVMALISISLAIINLLPLPPLDGGHLLLFGIEKIKGRPVDRRVLEIVAQTGWILLIMLMLVVTWNDIFRFFAK